MSDPQDSVSWSLIPQTVSIAVGQKQQIGASTRGSATTWTSDNPRVVSVSTTGLASALAPGRATVVLRLHGRADTTLITVHAAVRAVHMAASSTPLAVGGAMGLGYSATDPAGDEIRDLQGTTISWVSRNADVASVDSSGLVRAKSVGTTEIILSINGAADSTSVHVTPEAPPGSPVEPLPPSVQPVKPPATTNPPPAAPATASVAVTLDSASLATGHASAAHAVAKDPKGNVLSGKTAIWTSLNTHVASVSTAGVVTAQSAGTASIQGTIDGVSGVASLSVIVPPAAPPPASSPDLAEPTFDGTQATMLFQQNFDSYTTDSLRPPCGTPAAATPRRVVDHAVAYCNASTSWTYDAGVTVGPGHSGNGVQVHYDGVYQETHGIVTTITGSTGKAATVAQYWAKFTPDVPGALTSTDQSGVGNAIIQIKNIMLWHDANGESGRFQAHLGAHTSNCPIYGPSYTMVYGLDSVQVDCDASQPVGPYFKDFANSQWHRWTVLFKPNTSSGSRDGIARVWIDGILVVRIEQSACSSDVRAKGGPAGGWKSWCTFAELDGLSATKYGIRALEWGANRTDGSGIPFTMAIDDITWWVMK